MYSIEELANDFHRLGIGAADTVMLHASVRAVPVGPIRFILPSNRC